MRLMKKCPVCGQVGFMDVDAEGYTLLTQGVEVQDAFPTYSASEKQFIATGLCYNCQEKVFNVPAPGHEKQFGKLIGNCPWCKHYIWAKDAIREDVFVCPSCGTIVNDKCEEV